VDRITPIVSSLVYAPLSREERAMPQLRIWLLGSVRCAWDGCQPIRLGRAGQILLGYLVLHRSRPHSRERLAALLWGDADDDRPRRCLNTALWRLRQSLAPQGAAQTSWISSTPAGEIGFAPGAGEPGDAWIDVEAFGEAVRQAIGRDPVGAPAEAVSRLEAAVGLYAGDLLECCYDDWVLPERRALHELLMAGLEWLIRHHAAGARIDAALDAGRRLLMHDPLREDIHRELMGLYEASGRRGEALRQYDYCRDVLASELGLTPDDETETAHRRLLLQDDAVPAAKPPPRASTVPPPDRRQLLEMLEQVHALERALVRMLATAGGSPPG
jgi:DNA-binding SARP family transcriptional activator